MKHLLQLLATVYVCGVSIFQLGLAPANAQSANASFVCKVSGGTPTTFAITKRGQIPVIRWVSNYFDDYPPQRRCEIVSEKFQNFSRSGELKYITAGYVNRLPVICATGSRVASCSSSTVLFTLKPGQDPRSEISQLESVRYGARNPLEQTTGKNTSIDFNDFLSYAPTENVGDAPSAPSSPPVSSPTSEPSLW
jgi:hypothetical protein